MRLHRHPDVQKLLGFVAAGVATTWLRTMDFKALYCDPTVDAAWRGPDYFTYVHWHEYVLFPLLHRGGCNLALLVSQHGDGEILSSTTRRLGYATIRGSSSNRGASAVRQMLRECQDCHVAVTPDGPRGPRRILSSGPIYLASKLGRPLVSVGMGFDRPWRLKSWDALAIPRPYSRARVVFGPPMYIPPRLSRDDLAWHRATIETQLNDLTTQAEDWARSGQHRAGEYPWIPQRMPMALVRKQAAAG